MVRKSLIIMVFCSLPSVTFALGLGKIELNSALNQPFDARVELLSASAEEIQSLNVGLADVEAFQDESTPAEPDSFVSSEDSVSISGAGEYGPTISTDTLWSIAASQRPDSSFTVQQMMLALQRANPEAFLDDNINGLKRGQILRIPDADEISSLTQVEALEQVKSQYAAWEPARETFSETTPSRPVSTADQPSDDSGVIAEDENRAELRLVAATDDGSGTEQGDGSLASDESDSLALADEQLQVISQDNLELKDRLTEAESIIEDLRRLLALQDDELAVLQQQASTEGIIEDSDEFIEEEALAPPPAPVAPIEAPLGLVGQVQKVIMDNMIMIAGGLGGLIIIGGGAVFLVRRKRAAGDAISLDNEELDEDLLDATSVTSAGADASELLEVSEDSGTIESDDSALDFDIGGVEEEPAIESSDDESLDFDIGGVEEEVNDIADQLEGDNVLEPDVPGSDGEIELETAGDTNVDGEVELDLNMDGADGLDIGLDTDLDLWAALDDLEAEAETMEIDLDNLSVEVEGETSDTGSDDGLEIDLSIGGDDADLGDIPALDLSTGEDKSDSDSSLEISMDDLEVDGGGLEIDMELDAGDDNQEAQTGIDMDETVQVPNIDMDFLDDDDDDHTVFVPRTSGAEQQTEEDEVATKLDLAKAYVELGDKDSAKSILDEVIADGNEQQRQQAQELMGQVS